MAKNRFGWRSIVAAVSLVLAACGIHKNIQQGIPDDVLPGYAIGLYTPAAVLIVISIALIVSEFRRRVTD